MNWLKRMIRKFTSQRKPKLREEYIMNETYKDVDFVKEFLERRKECCKKDGIDFSVCFITYHDFETIGRVELFHNGKVIENARLTRYYNTDKICWKFYE